MMKKKLNPSVPDAFTELYNQFSEASTQSISTYRFDSDVFNTVGIVSAEIE